jgi:hypothetical protein
LQVSPSIDDIWKQSTKELEIVKIASIKMQCEYFSHPLGYKYVQGQFAIVFKGK